MSRGTVTTLYCMCCVNIPTCAEEQGCNEGVGA